MGGIDTQKAESNDNNEREAGAHSSLQIPG